MSLRQLAVVAVDSPLENLTYLQNPDFTVSRGDVVTIPLGNRKESGIVVRTYEEKEAVIEGFEYKLKPISNLNTELPKLSEFTLKWLEWVASYYLYPLGKVAQLCFPPLKKATQIRKSKRPDVIPTVIQTVQHRLNAEQQNSVDAISKASDSTGFSTHLVHGVTGERRLIKGIRVKIA